MSIDTPEPSSTKTELIGSIVGTFDTLAHKIKQGIRKRPLSNSLLADGHIIVLLLLSKSSVLRASDIAAELGITSGAVTCLADKLAGLGYVTRERSDEDRRVVLLSLTEEGRSCLARVRQERLERIASVVGKLETEDLEKLLDVFQKLMFVLEKE